MKGRKVRFACGCVASMAAGRLRGKEWAWKPCREHRRNGSLFSRMARNGG